MTGIVTAPNPAEFASAGSGGFLRRLASFIMPLVYADVIGIAPVTGATVELDTLDSAGNVSQILATTTTDSTGTYTFTNVPAVTDSSLQVRVMGQSDTMRAIVTGTIANISPVSEVVVSDVVSSLGASVPLQNYSVEEIAALISLLQGMDHDITGLTFSQAVSAIQGDASGPLFSQLLADFSAAGSSTVLHGSYYAMTDMRSVLRDPHLLPSTGAPGGIEIDSGYGPLIFPASDDRPSPGLLFYGAYVHDLTSVSDLASSPSINDLPFGRSLGTLLHVSSSKGQLVLADTADPTATAAGIGALTTDASLMVYPVDASARINSQLSWFGMGLRLSTRWLQPTGAMPLDLTILDATGAGTPYHQVAFQENMLGQGSGSNAVSLVTRVGSVTFNSTPAPGAFDRTYGTFAENVATDSLSMDLGAYTISQAIGNDTPSGLYYVFTNGGQVQFADATAALLGLGSTIEDGVRNGEVVASQQFSGGFASPVTQGQRTFSVAIRQASGLANSNLSGTYNLVQYAGYLSATTSPADGTIASGIRYGTISLDGSGNVTGGNLYQKRASMDLAAAATAASPNSSGLSGTFTTATATAASQTFSLAVGGVTVFTFTSAASGDTVTAADIDGGISTNSSALSAAGITFTGTAATGDLVFTKTDGSAFDIVVTNQFTSTAGTAGGFANFPAGTTTVNNGTPAVPATSGTSGAFTGVTLAGNQRYTLTVGGVPVYDSAGASSTSATDIDNALAAATASLSSAGISFTGTAVGGNLVFSKADGTAFDIVIANGSGLGGFANFPTGTTTVNNGTPVVVTTSGSSGAFTNVTLAPAQRYTLTVGGVSVYDSAGALSTSAADIDSALAASTASLSAAGISFTGTAAAGDLALSKADGSSFDIVVVNDSGTGGFANFLTGTTTVNNGTAAASNASVASGTFTDVTLGAGQNYTLTVGGVSVYSSAGASATTAADIDNALAAATASLSAVGISFTGTAAGGNLVFSKADGTAFDIVITNDSGAGGFASFPTGTTTVNNGTPAVPSTSGPSGAFTSVTLAPAQRYSLTVGSVSVYDSAGALSTSAADIDNALTTATANLSMAGISFTGTAAAGDLAFSKADGTAFDIVIVNDSGAGGFANFLTGTTTVNNGSPAVPSTSNPSGAFTTVTLAPAQRYTLTVGGVSVYDSAGAGATSATDIDNALAAATGSLSTAGISFTGTAAGGNLAFSKADGSAFNIVIVNDSGAGGFANFLTGTTTVSNGSAAVSSISSLSGTFTTAIAGASGQTFTLNVGGVVVFNFTSAAAGDQVTAADIDGGIAAQATALNAAGITYSGTVAGGDLQFMKADGTSFTIAVTDSFSSVTTTSGGFAGTDFATGTNTIANGSAATLSLSSAVGQETVVAGGSYNVSADGTLTLNLTVGSENLSGSGAVTQEGDFAAVAITSDDTVRKGRGLLVLVRQP